MKTKKTQEERIINKLFKDGFITRNEALQNFISRLGAIICDMQTKGWEFEAKFIKTDTGRDYIYRVIKSPFKKVEYTIPDGRTIIRYEK